MDKTLSVHTITMRTCFIADDKLNLNYEKTNKQKAYYDRTKYVS